MKAILELEMPDNCQDCRLSWFDGRDWYCIPNVDILDNVTVKQSNCPLKEVGDNT